MEEVRPEPAEGEFMHPQFAGVQHCGSMARALETERGHAFKWAVRTRYDLEMLDDAASLGSLPSWGIWKDAARAPLLALHKGNARCKKMSCMPQDVFWVARYDRGLGAKASHSMAPAFEGKYDHCQPFPTAAADDAVCTRDARDVFEAVMFSPWLERRLPMYVVTAAWRLHGDVGRPREVPAGRPGEALRRVAHPAGARRHPDREAAAGAGD